MRYREPEKFEELRRAYFEWDFSMPPRPEDAEVHLEYTGETMASPTVSSVPKKEIRQRRRIRIGGLTPGSASQRLLTKRCE